MLVVEESEFVVLFMEGDGVELVRFAGAEDGIVPFVGDGVRRVVEVSVLNELRGRKGTFSLKLGFSGESQGRGKIWPVTNINNY